MAAAGNDATSVLMYPAADENVIGVGALADGSYELAGYSNYGDNSDVVAPGTMYTTLMGGTYGTINGTSFASPIVAGAIALLKNQSAYMETEEVRELLYASTADIGSLGDDWFFGYGALDVNALVCEERGIVTFDMLTDEVFSCAGVDFGARRDIIINARLRRAPLQNGYDNVIFNYFEGGMPPSPRRARGRENTCLSARGRRAFLAKGGIYATANARASSA